MEESVRKNVMQMQHVQNIYYFSHSFKHKCHPTDNVELKMRAETFSLSFSRSDSLHFI